MGSKWPTPDTFPARKLPLKTPRALPSAHEHGEQTNQNPRYSNANVSGDRESRIRGMEHCKEEQSRWDGCRVGSPRWKCGLGIRSLIDHGPNIISLSAARRSHTTEIEMKIAKILAAGGKTSAKAAAKQLHLSGNSKWISPGRKNRTEPSRTEPKWSFSKRRQRSEPKIDTNQLTFVPFISGLWSLNLSHVWLRLPVRSVRLEPRFALYNCSGSLRFPFLSARLLRWLTPS